MSELTFAAFYADCEHEVRPITRGNRVCLTYNLTLAETRKTKRRPALTPPRYEREVAAAAKILPATFRRGGAPMKLAWLLEHQYSAAGLSSAGLKGQDAAHVQVLTQAAERAGCAAYLGIVHIEETGPAEPHFELHEYGGWHSGWQDDDATGEEDDLAEEQEAADDDDFEVIEVSDAWRYVDHWVDTQNRSVDFGRLPVEENELLPAGALDNAAPDKQRLTEATGNEGASFERSYRRAALVMWPRNRSVDVLLQGGARAVMPYLKDIARRCSLPSASRAERAGVRSIAGRIVKAWKRELADIDRLRHVEEASRPDMISVLGQLADAAGLQAFVNDIVMRTYDGSENEALAANGALFGARRVGRLFSNLARAHVPSRRRACVDLLSRLVHERDGALDSARVIVSALSLVRARDLKPISADDDYQHLWHHAATKLLARSEHPPEGPKDWRQAGRIRCACGDCRELQTFVLDPVERTHRFRVRKDRRRHLHEQIQRHGLDMTHETERRGWPANPRLYEDPSHLRAATHGAQSRRDGNVHASSRHRWGAGRAGDARGADGRRNGFRAGIRLTAAQTNEPGRASSGASSIAVSMSAVGTV